MKLKYHFLSGLILACGLGLSSCNDSFLERNPKDQLSDISFWKTADDANKYATGIYLYLIEPENHTIMTDCYTDNAIPVHVGAEQESCQPVQPYRATLTSCSSGRQLTRPSAAARYSTSTSEKFP